MSTSHGIHLTSPSRGPVLCVGNPGKGRARSPADRLRLRPPCVPALGGWDWSPGSPARLAQRSSVRCVEGPPTWHAAWCPWLPTCHLWGRLLAWPLRALLAPKHSAAPCEWHRHAGMHGKGFGIQSALLCPCSLFGSDLPLAIVSKDQGIVANLWKDQWEPPVNETSSRGSALSHRGEGAWALSWGSMCVSVIASWVGLLFFVFLSPLKKKNPSLQHVTKLISIFEKSISTCKQKNNKSPLSGGCCKPDSGCASDLTTLPLTALIPDWLGEPRGQGGEGGGRRQFWTNGLFVVVLHV